MSRNLSVGALIAVAALVAACGGSSGDASPSAAASTVNVVLQEFAVTPDVASVPAGSVTFNVNNTGPEDIHEFVDRRAARQRVGRGPLEG